MSLLTEPEAAAINYAGQQRVETGEVVAVYDFGGGTFDAAVVRKTPSGFEIIGVPEGIERLGGIDIDAAVLAHVDTALDGQLRELDTSDPAVRSALSRLRDECRRAKEALSTDTDTSIPVSVPGLQTEVRLTRAELEAMIRPRIRETVDALERAVASASLSMADVSRILLVGGTSRIPLIGEILRETTGRPVALDAHPKFAICSGAAAEAGRIAAEKDAEKAAAAAAATTVVATPATAKPAASAAAAPSSSAPAEKRGGPPIVPIAIGLVVLVAVIGGGVLVLGHGSGGGATASPGATKEPGASVAQAATQSAAAATPEPTPGESSAADDAGPGDARGIRIGVRAGRQRPGLRHRRGIRRYRPVERTAVGRRGRPSERRRAQPRRRRRRGAERRDRTSPTTTALACSRSPTGSSTSPTGQRNAGENDVPASTSRRTAPSRSRPAPRSSRSPPGGGGIKVISDDKAVEGTSGAKVAYGPDGTLYFGTGRLNPRVFRIETTARLTPVAGTGSDTATSAAVTGPAVNTSIGRVERPRRRQPGPPLHRRRDAGHRPAGGHGRHDVDDRRRRRGGPRTGQGAPRPTSRWPRREIGVEVDDQDRLYVSDGSSSLIFRWRTTVSANLIASDGRNHGLGHPAIETGFHFPHPLRMTPGRRPPGARRERQHGVADRRRRGPLANGAAPRN